MSTFNVYGRQFKVFDVGNKPVWESVDELWTAGGVVTPAPAAGTLIPAGTPVYCDGMGGKATIYDGVTPLTKVTGLVWNDVYVDDTMSDIGATVAIVTKGKILKNRCPKTVTDEIVTELENRITFTI